MQRTLLVPSYKSTIKEGTGGFDITVYFNIHDMLTIQVKFLKKSLKTQNYEMASLKQVLRSLGVS